MKGEWNYLYRAVDKSAQTLDLLLTAQRDERAAARCLAKAMRRHGVPDKVTIEGRAAHAAAIRSYHQEHGPASLIRQVKYVVEQDHRAAKRVTHPMLGFESFEAAPRMLVGIELMHMLKKGQLTGDEGVEDLTPAAPFYALAA